jgi:hypothetical protein
VGKSSQSAIFQAINFKHNVVRAPVVESRAVFLAKEKFIPVFRFFDSLPGLKVTGNLQNLHGK